MNIKNHRAVRFYLATTLISGTWRVVFAEDRAHATGYGTRNSVHWPLSILGAAQ